MRIGMVVFLCYATFVQTNEKGGAYNMSNHDLRQEYQMPMTLERHFEELREQDGLSTTELYSLYKLLKPRLMDRLISSRSVFINYSLHDASHSQSIIQAIERFLGENRIRMLSPTDTFMLLICAYAHDYGMAQSYSTICNILGSKKFEDFLRRLEKDLSTLEKEDAKAITNLLAYLNRNKDRIEIKDIYLSIALTMQLYLRTNHWSGVIDLEKDFQGLFEEHIKRRFITGSEGIVDICMCHGKDFKDIFRLSPVADGMVGDDFHPRFVASMLRLGDLLDLDNNRFPLWFAREAAEKHSLIPQLSILHYRKHEAISHLLITDEKISIRANCNSKKGGYETANLVSQWTGWLERECHDLRLYWDEIAPAGFGRPPQEPDIQIYVDGRPYRSSNQKMKMQMSQERVMKLLEGTSIYRDKYVGIREVIQNAVDASLLKLWEDIKQNVHLKCGLSKNHAKSGLKLTDFAMNNRNTVFADYDILVEVIKDLQCGQIIVVVKDKGIGIALEDIKFIADIGSSKENNTRLRRLMEDMPAWMKPSGIFGIGLQSVFQLTDCIEFYTRQPNQPERRIALYSYGKSKGKIDVHDLPPNDDGMFYDNTAQGTNVKLVIDPHKMISSGEEARQQYCFLHYDVEFDFGDEIDVAYAEICQVCKERIRSVKCDYFNIFFQEIIRNENGEDFPKRKQSLRRSYFLPRIQSGDSQSFPLISPGDTIRPLIDSKGDPCIFIDNSAAYFWDEQACRRYYLKIRPCDIQQVGQQRQVFLPEAVQTLCHVSYKFNDISNTETIYHPRSRSKNLHAGFLDWSILILDGEPTRYLNIDRDYLREGAISEKELLELLGPILKKWCDYFCRQSSKHRGKNRFISTPGALLSFILLFYQNIPPSQFQEFIKPYQGYLESMSLVVGEEKIPITYFWDNDRLFQTRLPLPVQMAASKADIPSIEAQSIRPETLRHFPRRLVQIDSIHNDQDGKLVYRFRFGPARSPHVIEMSDIARLTDYIQVFDAYIDHQERVDYTSIQKKVFKPDQKYSHLAIPCYPHTFSRGKNFSSHLDDCIHWYILSPFDRDTAQIIRKSIDDGKYMKQSLLENVKSSVQFKKCVKYVAKKRYENDMNQEAMIQCDYEEFIDGLYESLYQNRSFIKHLFQRDHSSL